MEQINLYKLVLDNWYWNRFNSISNYQKTIIAMNGMSNIGFTEDFRTIRMNLGRRQGASTAIQEFIKDHLDLNIIVIFPNQSHLDYFKSNNLKFNTSKLKLYSSKNMRGITIQNDVDIVFIDVASYTDHEEVLEASLSQLNSSYNKNQWVIKFG